jgi:hypothetical protein
VLFADGVTMINEIYLQSTGRFTSEKKIYTGDSIRVIVDQNGEKEVGKTED